MGEIQPVSEPAPFEFSKPLPEDHFIQSLSRDHINFYLEEILSAKRTAEQDIATAMLFAREMKCEGCEFCKYLERHAQVLDSTTAGLILIVDSLSPGMRSSKTFPRTYGHHVTVYRGFIAEDGRYLSVWGSQDHDKIWEEYAKEHGKEQAYKLIKVSGSYGRNKKALVMFRDRKAPPSPEQYETLKELMIDAKGDLRFRFVYDPSHPN